MAVGTRTECTVTLAPYNSSLNPHCLSTFSVSSFFLFSSLNRSREKELFATCLVNLREHGHLCFFFARYLVNFWASGMGSFFIANNNINEPYLLKVMSREMGLTKIRLIQKVFIKETGSEIFRKFRPPLSL